MAPAHLHPGPGKGSGPKPEGARRWETLPGTGSSSQQAQAVWWEDRSFLSGFLAIEAEASDLQGHWLPLTLPPAEEQGQSWWAGGRLRRGWGLGCTPAPHVQTPRSPEDPPAALTQHRCSQPLGVSGACPGAKGDLAQCPLGQGQTLGRRGPLLGPWSSGCSQLEARNQGHLRKCQDPPSSKGACLRGGLGTGQCPGPGNASMVTYRRTLLSSAADRCVNRGRVKGGCPGGASGGWGGLGTCRGSD